MKMRFLISAMLIGTIVLMAGGCKRKDAATPGGRLATDRDRIDIIGSDDIFGIDMMPYRPDEGSVLLAPDGGNFFNPVYFPYDSSQIGSAERAKIEEVADYMRGESAAGLIIEGHTDERGSREYNLALGERRALAVRAYLVGLGIDGSRVQTKSYGEENPAVLGHDESAWSLNRRAEFVLFY